MSFDLPPVGGVTATAPPPTRPARPAEQASFPGVDAFEATPRSGEVPATPPAEASAAVARAAARADELAAQGRHLRFEPDPDGGRVRVEVVDREGQVIRTIPLTEALDIAGGAPAA